MADLLVRTAQKTIDLAIKNQLLLAYGVRITSNGGAFPSTATLKAFPDRLIHDDELAYVTAKGFTYQFSRFSTAADDGDLVLAPNDQTGAGRWLKTSSTVSTGYAKAVRIHLGEDSYKAMLRRGLAQRPSIHILFDGMKPYERSLVKGTLYQCAARYKVRVIPSSLRSQAQQVEGSDVATETDPGTHQMIGDVILSLAGSTLSTTGITYCEIGEQRYLELAEEGRLTVEEIEITAFYTAQLPDTGGGGVIDIYGGITVQRSLMNGPTGYVYDASNIVTSGLTCAIGGSTVAATPYTNAVTADAPKLWWRFNDAAASATILDTQGFANGTELAPGATLYQQAGLITESGQFAQGAINSSTSGISATVPAGVPTTFTLEWWGSTQPVQANENVLIVQTDAGDFVAVGPTNGTGAGAVQSSTSSFAVPAGTFGTTAAYFVVYYDGSHIFFYKNASLVGNSNITPSLAGARITAIAFAAAIGGGFNFGGYIDELALYDHVLSTARITAHYTAGSNPPGVGGISSTIAAGVAVINGTTVNVSATAHTFPVNSDTYRDLHTDGTYSFTSVANGSPAPPVVYTGATANTMRIGATVTSASAVIYDAMLASSRVNFG